jgi:hypothetical protein
MVFYPTMMLKIIFIMILCFAYFISGMENWEYRNIPTTNLDDNIHNDTPRFLKFSQIYPPIHVLHETPPNFKNQSKIKKKKLNLFSCSCCKTKSKKKYKAKEEIDDDDPTSIIKIKTFDQCEKSKMLMVRKTSAPTQSVSTPIMLTRRFSEESVQSAVFLSRKSSAESVNSPTLLIRKSSAPSSRKPKMMMVRKTSAPNQSVSTPLMLTRKFSEESVKSAVFLSRKSSAESVNSPTLLIRKSSAPPSNNLSRKPSTELLGRKFSAKRNEIEKAKETLEEEASEYVDICSFELENVLFYVCLQENVENCEKCKTLNHIFQTQTFEDNYLLYKLFLHEIFNPNQHDDLENIPIWLECLLSSLLAEQQDMTFSIGTIDHKSNIQNSYRSKRNYAKLLTTCAKILPSAGGRLFFSVLNSKLLDEKGLPFFVKNDIITIEDEAMFLGDKEGLQVFGNDEFENIFYLVELWKK